MAQLAVLISGKDLGPNFTLIKETFASAFFSMGVRNVLSIDLANFRPTWFSCQASAGWSASAVTARWATMIPVTMTIVANNRRRVKTSFNNSATKSTARMG